MRGGLSRSCGAGRGQVMGSMTALLNVCLFNGVMLVIFGIMGVHLYGFDTPFFEEHGLPR